MGPTTRHPPARRAAAGFSLTEAMIVLAVAAVVAATAAPSFAGFVDGRRLDATAQALASDVQLARNEAIARNRPLRLSIRASGTSTCWIIHSGPAAQCSCAGAGPAVCTGDATEIKTVVLGPADRVSVQANVGSILFDPLHGTSTPTGTLRLVDTRGRAVHHVVNIMGRVRSCSPGGAVAGWRSC